MGAQEGTWQASDAKFRQASSAVAPRAAPEAPEPGHRRISPRAPPKGTIELDDNGGKTEPGTNLSHSAGADGGPAPSSNRRPFTGRYRAPYAQGAGMEGDDACGMFVGSLYSELLKLDDPTISGSTMDGWRGADRVMLSSRPKLWPIRNLEEPFGVFQNWKDDVRPRAGDVVVISFDEFTRGLGNEGSDIRTPTHVAMVEEWDESAKELRTIDGNAPLLQGGDRLSNAVSGRGYDFAAGNTDGLDETMFRYHQSRVVCAIRMTERSTNFEAPVAPPGATGPSTGELLRRLIGAHAQVQAVLNHLADASMPFHNAEALLRQIDADRDARR